MTLGIALPGTALGLWRNPVAALFSTGEQGAWYDPSDFSTMYQDSAGTTPVTAAGQPVGRINDKSGRGNHATQSTAASRPILRQDASGYYYLEFDGVDDSLATASVDFSATDKMTVWAGVHKASDATAFAILCELGNRSAAQAGSFSLTAPGSAAGTYFSALEGTAASDLSASTYTAPISNVLSLAFDLSQASRETEMLMRVNGATPTTVYGGAVSAGTGNFGNFPLYIGRRGGSSLPFNGRLYSLVVRGAATDSSLLSRVERHVGGRMGLAL